MYLCTFELAIYNPSFILTHAVITPWPALPNGNQSKMNLNENTSVYSLRDKGQ